MKGCDHILTVTNTGWLWFWRPLRFWLRCYHCDLRRGPFVKSDTVWDFIIRYTRLTRRWRRQ